ncbi:hypothetical protein HYDPIDRAFT_91366, partial [Hydnomerulius pinastri MD-312]
MSSTTSTTFATLSALHTLIGDALEDIQRVFSQDIPIPPSTPSPRSSQCSSPAYTSSTPGASPPTSSFPTTPSTSFPPTPVSATFPSDSRSRTTNVNAPAIDYPSPDGPFISASLSEQLAAHPDACAAALKIVAACGQMSNIVHKPFLSLCDAVIGYNLPACIRLVEHLHIAEILREAEDERQFLLSQKEDKVVLTPERSNEPALSHVLRLLSTHHLLRETAPNVFALTRVASLLDSGKSVKEVFASYAKYRDSNGTAAFVGLTTDELFKSAAYLTEAFTGVQLPASSAFNLAFQTAAPFFDWLEDAADQPKSFRLERFSKAMTGTSGWEAPGAILSAFDWHSLPRGSTIIDVGGGIGSTTIASDESPNEDMHFRFIVQDRPVVTGLGIAAWRTQCLEMLESGQVQFQVYLLRVVLHDWPDSYARRILINLRVASAPETRLIIADHVLPLACNGSEPWTLDSVLANVEGAEQTLAIPPLLPNLGKASANVYWMDLLMHITFNGKERTLREFCALALSAGWRVTRMTRSDGSLFAHLVCEPV